MGRRPVASAASVPAQGSLRGHSDPLPLSTHFCGATGLRDTDKPCREGGQVNLGNHERRDSPRSQSSRGLTFSLTPSLVLFAPPDL